MKSWTTSTSKFGDTARQSFITKTKDFTRLLYQFPEIGTVEIPDKKLRGFQLTKQTRVFYRLKNDQIIFLTHDKTPENDLGSLRHTTKCKKCPATAKAISDN